MALDSFPQTLHLPKGGHLTLAVVQPGDAEGLLAFYRQLPEEDRQFLKADVTSADWAEGFLKKVREGEIISLVAKAEGRVVAEASLYRTLHGWTRHVGEVRVAVHKAYRRQGLATALASALVKIATDCGIEKIIVQVVENQAGARRLFEKLGFHKEAVLPHHVMDVSGIKRDLQVLANDVSLIWAAMEAMNQDYAPHLEGE
jgi:ribosomal protein S18 acetylase RimI-like enzyme